jgi:murein DD-endopeptidase MepM/ murein hydrolase activator NlpD
MMWITSKSTLGTRAPALCVALLVTASLACEVVPKESASKVDTTTRSASSGTVAPRTTNDSPGGVPAVPSDSTATAAGILDSGRVQLFPQRPERGGLIFALAEGIATEAPRCSWKGAPIPCYRVADGVLVTIPIPADEPAGTFTLSFDRPAGRITRQITVADKDFGRELIFLNDTLNALVHRSRDIARDARALRGILSAERGERLWSGRWREPVIGSRRSGYGVERFYYPGSDSTRAITVATGTRARGSFAADTSSPASGEVPSWRHAGVDIAAVRRTPVAAPAAGMVTEVGEYTLTGNTLIVDHGHGVMTAYFHLDTVLVHKGDLVRPGKTLARVGATGLATGPHLHYGVYVHGNDVDPAAWYAMPPFVRADSSVRVTAAADRPR